MVHDIEELSSHSPEAEEITIKLTVRTEVSEPHKKERTRK
jgi:hypothetical protein